MRTTPWLVLALSLAVAGCGKKSVEETPAPETGNAVPPSPPPAPAPAPAPPPPASTGLSAADRATLETRIHFAYDKYDLSAEARQILQAKSAILLANTGITIRIEGHADERGTDEYNLVLSNRRAAEAKRFLTSQGIDASRIEVMGYGEEQPLRRGNTEEDYAANRRAEFRITGGAPAGDR